MTSKEIQLPSGVGAPDRVGQATAVEQSRAIAEVQGAIIVAQKVPRNVAGAVASMTESCSQMYLAERAQFRFPRGGTNVSGTSVYLARELARCWGNVQYGVSELRRDDYHGQSEMMAYAWDVQTNTRIETKFIVVHVRDTKTGTTMLVDQRDIYENNANNGARRVRECILSILPPWFVDQAKALCAKTLKDGGGVPMPKRIAETVANFAKLGVTQSQLEKKQGRGTNAWTEVDIAQLHVIGRSLSTGEARREDEFEPDLVTMQDMTDAAPSVEKPAAVPPPQEVPTEAAKTPAPQPNTLPDITPFVPDEDVPSELGLKAEAPGQSTSDVPQEDDQPTGGGTKASKALVAAVKTLLADNDVPETADQRAVVSFLSGERVPMLADLTDTEARYLLKRIPELAEKGTFPDTVERARAAAKS
jgi:hypothetical protein